ncbi:hypothetical protein [Acuticoccus mangrovi]|uniref:Uncharacterized protein n=1 Tax=Acuticoccus mangrovi TaxID=2796142 RepID=A0A934MLC7_9HYPH|nr:hypothetical protein [Acuticoccus mangrovi]MBJ3776249.1 hypothetical protein [Acuticoccus mangrovi]
MPSYTVTGGPADTEALVLGILQKIDCDIRDSVAFVFEQDRRQAQLNHSAEIAGYLRKWGILGNLTMTVREKSSVGASAVGIFPNAGPFTLGGGANMSAEANRTNSINFYELIETVEQEGRCEEAVIAPLSKGSLLIESDLKLKEWLFAQIIVAGTRTIGVPTSDKTALKKSALTHNIKFKIDTSASVSPKVVINTITLNAAGPIASAERGSVHEILLTIGPAGPDDSLTPQAAGAFQAAQIGMAVSRNLDGR